MPPVSASPFASQPQETALVPAVEFLRIAGGFRRILKTELGQEQLCSRCNEPWPMDLEFYNVSGSGVSYECKACTHERKQK